MLLSEFTLEEYMELKSKELLDVDIAKLKYVSLTTLSVWKRRNGIDVKVKKKPRLLEDFTVEEYLAYKNQGYRDLDISEKLYIHIHTLDVWKKRMGVVGVALKNRTRMTS